MDKTLLACLRALRLKARLSSSDSTGCLIVSGALGMVRLDFTSSPLVECMGTIAQMFAASPALLELCVDILEAADDLDLPTDVRARLQSVVEDAHGQAESAFIGVEPGDGTIPLHYEEPYA